MGAPPPTSSFSPGIQAMLPLLYAAWADRHLNIKEINSLRELAADLPFLTEKDKATLLDWSDPARPPARELFKQWEIQSRHAAELIQDGEPAGLAELGALLGREAGDQDEEFWMAQLPVLKQLEAGLGEIDLATYRSLFPDYDGDTRLEEEMSGKTFDPTKLQAIIEAPYGETFDHLREILTRPAFERKVMPVKEDFREQVLEWTQLLADEGYGAMAFPTEYGGENDMGRYATAFEMMAYHDLSLTIKFGVQFGLWGGAVANLGTKRHHDKYLAEIGTLELPGCFAMTETGHGSNVRGLETTAVYDSETDELIVHSPSIGAGKEYIGNAMHSKMAAVFCQLIVDGENYGVHAVVVPLRDEAHDLMPGITVKDNGYKMGLNGVDNGRIWFNKVRVPRENLLNRFGGVDEQGNYSSPIENPSRRFFTMLGTLVGGRVCVPRAGMSAAKSALAIAIRWGLKRRQFSPDPLKAETIILDYPNQQRRLFPRLAKAYAIQFALDYLLERYVNRSEEDMRQIEAMAAGMKAYATWFTTDCIQECREATGGKGYLSENRFADLKADSDIFTTFEGDNTVLMQLVAKSVLSDYKKELSEDGYWSVIKYMGRRIGTVVTEQNPLVIRQTERHQIETPDFYRNALRYRHRRLTSTLAQRFRSYLKEGMSAYEAGLKCQTHMMAAAQAYVERFTLGRFMDAVEKLEAGGEKDILQKLAGLYALHTIEEHSGWFQQQEYISGNKSKAISRVVDKLCGELRPEAGGLVAAFGIPDELLGAPIAL
ncbi:acyl-CoA oxidase [Lewinellaceae bacterium SD302]|nr:acyl-CoA oxidase [Lewinellaceae bacterium SD302]